MKFKVLLVLSSFSWFIANAQDRIPVELNNTQFNINILAPSVTFEKSINDHQSFTLGAGITALADFEEDQEATSLNPFISGSYRNYYPRKRVKKELRPNSGNYIGILTGYRFNSIADNADYELSDRLESAYYLGPVWCIQRNYQSGIHLGLRLGGGFGIDGASDIYFTGVGEFEFVFVIN